MSAVQPKSAPQPQEDSVYLQQALPRLPQIISTIDREPFSKTHGSFDRTHWCWKFTDFSAARFQEGVYTLAHFYTAPGNDLYQHPQALEWIKAGFAWWQKLQHRNGAFDEAYPFEMSYAATAFTCFYLGEAYALVKGHLPADTVETFRRAGEWFKHNDERHGVLTNHLAAGAAALYHIAAITGDASYEARAWFFISRILDRQSSEGWYEEYGGADIGYQTHGMFYLARIWQLSKSERILKSLERASDFIELTLNPDGTIGGEYASRNTEFYYPAAFEILSEEIPSAARVAAWMRENLDQAVGIPSMDQWNLYPVLNNYLFASQAPSPQPSPVNGRGGVRAISPLAFTGEGQGEGASRAILKDAGWVIERNKKYHATLGISKGGVIKAWKDRRLAFADCGYWIRLENGKTVSSQSFLRAPSFTQDGNSFSFEADFVEVNQKILNPVTFVGFRVFSIVLGHIPMLAYWLKSLLVKTLVKRRKAGPFKLKRTVVFTEGGFDITDVITPTSFLHVMEFRRGGRFATIHMGSSRYFQHNELELKTPDTIFGEQQRTDLSKGLQITLTQSFRA